MSKPLQLLALLAILAVVTVAKAPAAFADLNSDLRLLTELGLMRGHLSMARALTNAGDAEQASAQLVLPLRENFGAIAGELAERDITDLKDRLLALEAADRAKLALEEPHDQAIAVIDRAEATITASPPVILAASIRMLRRAAVEYDSAYLTGTPDGFKEYQDSMGIANRAAQMISDIYANLAAKNDTATTVIDQALTELLTAWPAPHRPATPTVTPLRVQDLVEIIAEKAKLFDAVTNPAECASTIDCGG
jgi:hypothetical protein